MVFVCLFNNPYLVVLVLGSEMSGYHVPGSKYALGNMGFWREREREREREGWREGERDLGSNTRFTISFLYDPAQVHFYLQFPYLQNDGKHIVLSKCC